MGELALKKLVFRAGATAGAAPLEIEPGVVTVFVGPNNSGKSRGLAEIATWAQGGVLPGLVIDAADVEFPATVDEAKALLGTYLERAPEPNMLRIATPTVPGSGGGQENVAEVDFSAAIEQDSAALPLHLQNARRRWTLRFFTAL